MRSRALGSASQHELGRSSGSSAHRGKAAALTGQLLSSLRWASLVAAAGGNACKLSRRIDASDL